MRASKILSNLQPQFSVTLEHIVRMLPNSFDSVKWLFYSGKGRRKFRDSSLQLVFSDKECTHEKSCQCDVSVLIQCGDTYSQTFNRGDPPLSQRDMNLKIIEWIQSTFMIGSSGLLLRPYPDSSVILKLGLEFSKNMQRIDGPFFHKSKNSGGSLPPVDPRVVTSVKIADYITLTKACGFEIFSPGEMEEQIFLDTKLFPNPRSAAFYERNKTKVPSLSVLAARKFVEYNRVFGETNGRRHVIHALEGLSTTSKLQNTILLKDQNVAKVSEEQRQVIDKIERALDLHYRLLGTDKCINTIEAKINPKAFENIALHASNGMSEGIKKVVHVDGFTYIYNPSGKKFEHYQSTMRSMFTCFAKRHSPLVTWSISPKFEMKFSTDKQSDDNAYHRWMNKHRIFEIPNAIYVYMERIMLFVRKILENNTRIKIGHRWPKGGADYLFKGLNIEGVFGDGDFEKFDQSIHAFFTNLFYSTLMIYYKEGPDEDLMRWISKQLAENCVARISHLYDDVWAEVLGGLPSGAYSTSNCGSWILHLMYCLFLTVVMDDLRMSKNRNLLRRIEVDIETGRIWIIVYGDDHVIHSMEEVNHLVGEQAFANWIGRVWNMKIRDLNNKKPLLSVVRNGELQSRGIVFLKQYFIKCNLPIPEPPTMVPFRPKSEIGWKAVWGREGKPRTLIDVSLSSLGIAYTMMGVNGIAHEWLQNLYDAICSFFDEGEFEKAIAEKVETMDIRKYRQYGISRETLLGGFPNRKILMLQNSKVDSYHTQDRDVWPMNHEDAFIYDD